MDGIKATAPPAPPAQHHDEEHRPLQDETKRPGAQTSSTSTSMYNSMLVDFGEAELGYKSLVESVDIAHYSLGPRDLNKHSKMPYFLRMYGSVFPKMLVPLIFVAAWSTAITVISKRIYDLGISSQLLTILGFVVGLSLSFRSTTAYERYAEGRRYWATLSMTSRSLARMIWIHTAEPAGEEGKEAALGKISGINLILAFAVALKHRLRFEPFMHYHDLHGLVAHLDTLARAATVPENMPVLKPNSPWKDAGIWLGLPVAESNPRKVMKRSKLPTGNLPMEVLMYLSAYIESVMVRGMMAPIVHGQMLTAMTGLTDILSATERVLSTPMPEAYSIATSQITWLYILALPFQLLPSLGWIAIPGTLAAAYIILGIACIGHEIENPFGHDVNDLPLDLYCRELAADLDTVVALAPPSRGGADAGKWWGIPDNKPLWPMSTQGYGEWAKRELEELRESLKSKVTLTGRLHAGGAAKTS